MINVFRKLAVNLLRRLASDDVVVLDVNDWIALRAASLRHLADPIESHNETNVREKIRVREMRASLYGGMTEEEVNAWKPPIANVARGGRQEVMDVATRNFNSADRQKILEAIRNMKR